MINPAELNRLADEWAIRNSSRFPVEHLAEIYAEGYADGLRQARRLLHVNGFEKAVVALTRQLNIMGLE